MAIGQGEAMKTDFDKARMMLVRLLADPLAATKLKLNETQFLVATCAARMMIESICAAANYKPEKALEGFEILVGELRPQLREICEEWRGPHEKPHGPG